MAKHCNIVIDVVGSFCSSSICVVFLFCFFFFFLFSLTLLLFDSVWVDRSKNVDRIIG
jgi:hypothetical protein